MKQRNDKQTVGRLTVRDGVVKTRLHPTLLKVGLSFLAGFWLASAQAQEGVTYTPLIIDDPAPQPSARFGNAVTGAGDVNGDGIPDLLVGAPQQGVGGQAFVFSGTDRSLLLTLDDPGPQPSALFGSAVAGAGGGMSTMTASPICWWERLFKT